MSHRCSKCGRPVIFAKREDGDKIMALDEEAGHCYAIAGKSGEALAYPLDSYGYSPHRCGDPEAVKEGNAILRGKVAQLAQELAEKPDGESKQIAHTLRDFLSSTKGTV